MPQASCTVCELEVKPRKLFEGMMRGGVGVRDVSDFSGWYANAYDLKCKVTKSALDRHKNNSHFDVTLSGVRIELDGEVMNLREYARKLFESYQKANQDKVPSTKELIDFLLADAKLADIEARRQDQDKLMEFMAGASYKKEPSESKAGDAGKTQGSSHPQEETKFD